MGQLFEFGLVVRLHEVAGVDVEAGVFPGEEHLDAFGREEFQVHKELGRWRGRVLRGV